MFIKEIKIKVKFDINYYNYQQSHELTRTREIKLFKSCSLEDAEWVRVRAEVAQLHAEVLDVVKRVQVKDVRVAAAVGGVVSAGLVFGADAHRVVVPRLKPCTIGSGCS